MSSMFFWMSGFASAVFVYQGWIKNDMNVMVSMAFVSLAALLCGCLIRWCENKDAETQSHLSSIVGILEVTSLMVENKKDETEWTFSSNTSTAIDNCSPSS
jgi:hypothetical protein